MSEKEYSESGSPIFIHSRNKEFEVAIGDEHSIEMISNHIEKHVGKISVVFHEIISDLVHIDVYAVAPTQERNFWTFVTSGMSNRAMSMPKGLETYRFAELLICLPASWPVSNEAFKDENNYWPIRWLKNLARLPHEYNTWLCYGHTMPNGDPAKPFANNTKFSCMMISLPETVDDPEGFFELKVNESKSIYFYSVVPIYKEETDFKIKRGADELLERFQQNAINELVDVRRKNVCK